MRSPSAAGSTPSHGETVLSGRPGSVRSSGEVAPRYCSRSSSWSRSAAEVSWVGSSLAGRWRVVWRGGEVTTVACGAELARDVPEDHPHLGGGGLEVGDPL